MADLTTADKRSLNGALRASFRSFVKLEIFLAQELVPGRQLLDITAPTGLAEVAFLLITEAESEGWLEDLVAAAAAARPKNQVFRELAAKLAPPAEEPAPIGTITFDLVDLSRFDLTQIEHDFRVARRSRRATRLIATAIACREELFMTSLRRRIETILGVSARPKLELDGAPWTATRVFDELVLLAPTLEKMPVLCPISVGANEEMAALWDLAKGRFTSLSNDLVLLLFIRPGTQLPGDVVLLSPPATPSADVEIWVEQVARALGWTRAYRDRLADEIIAEIEADAADMMTYRLYTKLSQVTGRLQIDIAAVRARAGAT